MPESDANEQSNYKKLKSKEFFKISVWILKFIYRISPKFATALTITAILGRLEDLVNTAILAKILDTLITSFQSQTIQINEIYKYLVILFVFGLIETVIDLADTWASNGLRTMGYPAIKRAFYAKLESLGIQTLEHPDVNDHIYRADTYLNTLLGYLQQTLNLVGNLVRFVVLVVVIASFLPIIIPIIIISAIPFYLFDKKQRSKLYKFIYENTQKQRMAAESVNDLSNSKDLQEINLTQAYTFLDNKNWSFQSWYANTTLKLLTKWRTGLASLSLISDITVIICVAKVFYDAFNRTITAGTMLFRYRVLNQFQGSIQNILRNLNELSEQAIRIYDVYWIFNAESLVKDGNLHMDKLKNGPEIAIKNVTFKYPTTERYVIENLNLNIKPGEKVAIVGANGAGKTTVVKLICKLYQVTSGEIIINNKVLKDLKIKDWHKNIGILFQDFNMYPQLTVRENILIGQAEEQPNDQEIRHAAEQADAADFINNYPLKYETVLSEKYKNGIRPSTGQWQKLAIARFFYRNAPLVIFDEPTASIDAISEYNIFNRIYEFFQNKTVIIISHRFSTVRNADRIIVLDKGKVIEEGSHDQLMFKKGKYAEAFLLQAKGYVQSIAEEE